MYFPRHLQFFSFNLFSNQFIYYSFAKTLSYPNFTITDLHVQQITLL